METNSCFDVSLCITWTFNTNHSNQVSPAFSFMNCLWHLQAGKFVTRTKIFLKNEDPRKSFQAFPVTTYKKHGSNELYSPQTRRCSPKRSFIWTECLETGNVTVVCFLGDGATSIQCTEKDAGPKRKYVSLDASSTSNSTSSEDDVSYLSQSSFSTSQCPLMNLESLSQDFSILFEKTIMPDVQLRSGDCTLTAHKVVLSARCEVFRTMFEHKMAESNSVDIKDIDPPVLGAFLKYLYSGKITEKLSDDMICKLYSTSDKYAVSSLSKLCSDFMAKGLREDNYLQILVLADTHSDEKLKKAVVEFVMKNNVLLTSENWITFSEKHLKLANEIYCVYVAKSVLK